MLSLPLEFGSFKIQDRVILPTGSTSGEGLWEDGATEAGDFRVSLF